MHGSMRGGWKRSASHRASRLPYPWSPVRSATPVRGAVRHRAGRKRAADGFLNRSRLKDIDAYSTRRTPNDPVRDQWFGELMNVLESEPEWH